MGAESVNLAKSFVKDAEKASKSSWLSKPQWDIAATNWDKAANAFKTAMHYESAVDCYVKASEAYVKVNIIFLAAKGFEEAATLTEKHINDHAKAITYYTRASDLYRSHGSSADRAAAVMVKAAEGCEYVDTDQSIQLYENALSIYESEDRNRFSIPTFKRLTAFLIKKNRLLEAAGVQVRLGKMCEQINSRPELSKSYLSAVILTLAFGDSVEAGKKLDEFAGNVTFVRSNEGTVANAMVEAYEGGDQEQFGILAHDQTVSFLDSAISRLALQIRVPGGKRAPQPSDNMAPGMSGAGAHGQPAYDAGVDEEEDLL
ncbi:hypothetical protein IWW50_005633 [Coemansia erecta]|nr:hypothetical protein GGF43_007005 [Coemansia sp. RSA 2618]KAJ2818950.1 hypothetical protein IWW50_005633 [Coemansia erecta]